MTASNASSVWLVTGGAGYIGSHVAHACLSAGDRVVVLDRLSTGTRANVPQAADFVQGDIADNDLVRRTVRDFGVTGVVHLAGSLIVEESVADPVGYYLNNTVGTLELAKVCAAEGVRSLVYSSSAAVYGQPAEGLVREDASLAPVNPYGRSKLFAEQALSDISAASGLTCVSLRYFNVAGVDLTLGSGPRNPGIRSLFKAVCATIRGEQEALDVYGTDCDTPDGSCVRDFIDVRDLANIHVLALKYLQAGGFGRAFNCGYGTGVSVLDVVRTAEAVIGRKVPVRLMPRRSFDPQMVVADPARLCNDLGWRPRFDDLHGMMATTLAWEEALAAESRVAEYR